MTTQPYSGLLHASPAIRTAKTVQVEKLFQPPLLTRIHNASSPFSHRSLRPDGDPVLTGMPITTRPFDSAIFCSWCLSLIYLLSPVAPE